MYKMLTYIHTRKYWDEQRTDIYIYIYIHVHTYKGFRIKCFFKICFYLILVCVDTCVWLFEVNIWAHSPSLSSILFLAGSLSQDHSLLIWLYHQPDCSGAYPISILWGLNCNPFTWIHMDSGDLNSRTLAFQANTLNRWTTSPALV